MTLHRQVLRHTLQWLVLQLVRGLPTAYDTVGAYINQTLPDFETTRSMLQLKQQRQNTTALATPAVTEYGRHRIAALFAGNIRSIRWPRALLGVTGVLLESMEPSTLPLSDSGRLGGSVECVTRVSAAQAHDLSAVSICGSGKYCSKLGFGVHPGWFSFSYRVSAKPGG